MAEVETYRLAGQMRVFLPAFFAVAAVGGLAGLATTLARRDMGGLIFLSVWVVVVTVQGWWVLMRMPWRIELDDDTVRFVARTRQVEVPWASLRSLRCPWFDLNRQAMVWSWEDGKLRTMGSWERRHHLLAGVEARAPHVTIDGL